MYRFLFSIALVLSVIACTKKEKEIVGAWRGVLVLQGQQLPFNFSIEEDSIGQFDLVIKNASELLRLDEVAFKGDSLHAEMHIFDAYLRAIVKGDSLVGVFRLNYNPSYKIPFKAALGQKFRFAPIDTLQRSKEFAGTYQVEFYNEKDTVDAIGIFLQKGNYAEGTFLTSTGDYRYLEGSVLGDTMHLSTFDGNHAYLFKVIKTSDSTLAGGHWLGKSRFRTWKGLKTTTPTLPNPESLTYLKEGYDRIEFSFPDVNGKMITPSDDRFKNKVLILQIFGTWCPNCMDEIKFLAPWYEANKHRGVEIVGLAYERKPDFEYASKRVKIMKEKFTVGYEFVIAGVNDNAEASKTLPMLNRVVAFPTTIFIGKDGKVKRIHTGFSGPGTGVYYEQFKEEFNHTINTCLAEIL
jgi:thiol-disulfide isomerase/thioredoxin